MRADGKTGHQTTAFATSPPRRGANPEPRREGSARADRLVPGPPAAHSERASSGPAAVVAAPTGAEASVERPVGAGVKDQRVAPVRGRLEHGAHRDLVI